HKQILGVCLGHQGIGEAFGAELFNLGEVMHGVASGIRVLKPEDPLFQGVPQQFRIGRYHSWAVRRETMNGQLQVLAEDEAGQVMALKHKVYNVYGVQFHPESVITEHGMQLIKNWVER
ncbi:MAG: aminodeoxychorismate/anthranilate synthase component II, partial [Bacteroidetes bacterium]